ncbi:MAG: YraN family protein [Candidatus Coatesbacteria bacterium]|nr:YraN family protein [Candidatus Coatesbacteria bacterium]
MNEKKRTSYSIGIESERIAEKYLLEKDYEIIEKRFHASHFDIDIIAKSPDDYIVFVEVKSVSSKQFGEAQYRITKNKMSNIIAAANSFLMNTSDRNSYRFDVIAIDMSKEPYSIEHLENAFSMEEDI